MVFKQNILHLHALTKIHWSIMNYYIKTFPGYDARKTITALNKSKEYIARAERDCNNVQKHAAKAVEYADEALSLVLPYKQNELKGVWIRPAFHSKNEIVQVLERLQKTGINNIFIETFYHGKTIFPSDTMLTYGFIEQNEEFVSFDPLDVWIKEAHKRNIKVHIWFETFYVGNKQPENYPNYILSVRPDWTNLPKNSADSNTPIYFQPLRVCKLDRHFLSFFLKLSSVCFFGSHVNVTK